MWGAGLGAGIGPLANKDGATADLLGSKSPERGRGGLGGVGAGARVEILEPR